MWVRQTGRGRITRYRTRTVSRGRRPVLRSRHSGWLPRGRPSSATERLVVSYRVFCAALTCWLYHLCGQEQDRVTSELVPIPDGEALGRRSN